MREQKANDNGFPVVGEQAKEQQIFPFEQLVEYDGAANKITINANVTINGDTNIGELDIDSGDAPKGQVLTADGDSGASWENRVEYLNLESESGNLTNAQIEVAEQDNVIIKLNGQFYYKNSQSDESIVFKAPAKVVDDDTIAEKVVIDLNDNTYSYSYEVVSAGSSFDPVYDDELNDSSTNAPQTKVVYAALEEKANVEDLEQYAQLNNIINAYDTTKTYNVNETVNYNGKIYKCVAKITTPEAFNEAHWEEITINKQLKSTNYTDYSIDSFKFFADGYETVSGNVAPSGSGRKVYEIVFEQGDVAMAIVPSPTLPAVGSGCLFDEYNLPVIGIESTATGYVFSLDGVAKARLTYWGGSSDADLPHFVRIYHKEIPDCRYNDILKKPYDFNGKTALFVGDSITKGYTSGTTTTNNNWVKLFSDKVGLTAMNGAVAGAAFGSSTNKILTQIQNGISANPDFIFIAGGINDWQLGITKANYDSALNELFTYLQNNYNGKVIVITPINHLPDIDRWTSHLYDVSVYSNRLCDYCIASGYDFIVGDKFNFSKYHQPSSFALTESLFGDGLHPSEVGHKLYADTLISKLM